MWFNQNRTDCRASETNPSFIKILIKGNFILLTIQSLKLRLLHQVCPPQIILYVVHTKLYPFYSASLAFWFFIPPNLHVQIQTSLISSCLEFWSTSHIEVPAPSVSLFINMLPIVLELCNLCKE